VAIPNEDFGRAVREALQWIGCTPETAAQTLGIKAQTVNAMRSGIVPMRSLVIRFGTEVARCAEGREGAPAWWCDIDAWLAVAGYPPRRDGVRNGGGPPAAELAATDLVRETVPSGHADPLEADPQAGEPAARHYRPCYDRAPSGDSYFHIFWVLDSDGRKVFQIRYPAPVDYRRRAAVLKHDLNALTKSQFERRYAAYRRETEA